MFDLPDVGGHKWRDTTDSDDEGLFMPMPGDNQQADDVVLPIPFHEGLLVRGSARLKPLGSKSVNEALSSQKLPHVLLRSDKEVEGKGGSAQSHTDSSEERPMPIRGMRQSARSARHIHTSPPQPSRPTGVAEALKRNRRRRATKKTRSAIKHSRAGRRRTSLSPSPSRSLSRFSSLSLSHAGKAGDHEMPSGQMDRIMRMSSKVKDFAIVQKMREVDRSLSMASAVSLASSVEHYADAGSQLHAPDSDFDSGKSSGNDSDESDDGYHRRDGGRGYSRRMHRSDRRSRYGLDRRGECFACLSPAIVSYC